MTLIGIAVLIAPLLTSTAEVAPRSTQSGVIETITITTVSPVRLAQAEAAPAETAKGDLAPSDPAPAEATPEADTASTVESAPSSAMSPNNELHWTREPSLFGLRTGQLIGYSAVGVGGVMALSGLIGVLTRDGPQTSFDPNTNTVSVIQSESPVIGWTFVGIGLGVAAAGGALLWLDHENAPGVALIDGGIMGTWAGRF